ncbi:hypothetical protein DICVIV_00173 [Dictyocaulus viviparus]|uniref:Uncharacterized protein n=1 Tax=Dictyocaulus viviparus TaxID=29172 RepID=A0A0D8YCI2_DICVI|nr:hypothetical protein DICVIV_00173 [Dictyocaulus viviparus]
MVGLFLAVILPLIAILFCVKKVAVTKDYKIPIDQGTPTCDNNANDNTVSVETKTTTLNMPLFELKPTSEAKTPPTDLASLQETDNPLDWRHHNPPVFSSTIKSKKIRNFNAGQKSLQQDNAQQTTTQESTISPTKPMSRTVAEQEKSAILPECQSKMATTIRKTQSSHVSTQSIVPHSMVTQSCLKDMSTQNTNLVEAANCGESLKSFES